MFLHGSFCNSNAQSLMSSKSRTISPFKLRKQHSLNSSNSNGKLSGLSTASMASFGSNAFSRTSSPPRQSSTPGKRRAAGPFSTSHKLQLRANASVGSSSPNTPCSELTDTLSSRSKENVTVTVRFRPLSSREIQKGDELAWYADGDTLVRSEFCAATAYAFDRVFGPATNTRHVYDAAARHVVQGAMEGVNGTVFAYGVTSSGKTHTMHGDQKSPGIIPLAIKNVFTIIQETPGREFLLRVSYLEIYNEVINDLLNPAGQNLRVREDAQGTYVEGIKEEVVLSPAHCLSLIATGEEHRHVGSNNFNLMSSRSHTIFTLTIESSPGENDLSDEEASLSQLNLIDLAGSESSKTETTGLRRKEGSYINKSLLTLGTVICKLTDGKATHIPYRDSKLTRLLQSSLSGHGRISLICTVTPATSTNEETHNTLKFAHRAKQVEIRVLPNKIMDEKSLIKKYQKEIQRLKHELEQLKRGIMENSQLNEGNKEDFVTLKQQLEAGQIKLQSRLEEEEQAKAALLGRIQRLTKLILVSTKNTASRTLLERHSHRRRHSFGDEELVLLPDRSNGFIEEEIDHKSELSLDRRSRNMIGDYISKNAKMTKRRNMLAWFKQKKNEHGISVTSLDSDNSSNSSSVTSGSQVDSGYDLKGRQQSGSRRANEVLPLEYLDSIQDGGLLGVTGQGRRPPPTGTTVAEQMDSLRQQVKMLAGDVAFCTSSLKRLSEQAALNSDDKQIQMQMRNLKDEIQEKSRQMQMLERQIVRNGESAPNNSAILDFSQAAESKELQHLVALREQVAAGREKSLQQDGAQATAAEETEFKDAIFLKQGNSHEASDLWLQLLKKEMEIGKLEMERDQLRDEKDAIQAQSIELAEEASYARELASAAAVELKNLAQEVTKLSFQNNKLAADLATAQELAYARTGSKPGANGAFAASNATGRSEKHRTNMRKLEEMMFDDLRKELLASQEREAALEALLAEKELTEAEIWQKMEQAKRKERDLENDLAEMWVLFSKHKKGINNEDPNGTDFRDLSGLSEYSTIIECMGRGHRNGMERMLDMDFKALENCLEEERHHSAELKTLVSQLKSEDLEGLDLAALEDLSALHVEALTRLCHAKARVQERLEKNENRCSLAGAEHCEDRNAHLCKVCFEAPTSTVLLPCCHFCLCKVCAVACSDCPLCRSTIQDKIILNT